MQAAKIVSQYSSVSSIVRTHPCFGLSLQSRFTKPAIPTAVAITTGNRSNLLKTRKFQDWEPLAIRHKQTRPIEVGEPFRAFGKKLTNLCEGPIDSDSPLPDPANATEKHYSVSEVSRIWGVSEDLVRDIFRGKSGVMRINRPATRMKRAYSTLRIPESTLNRIYADLSKTS
jgi:hypothetical protein